MRASTVGVGEMTKEEMEELERYWISLDVSRYTKNILSIGEQSTLVLSDIVNMNNESIQLDGFPYLPMDGFIDGKGYFSVGVSEWCNEGDRNVKRSRGHLVFYIEQGTLYFINNTGNKEMVLSSELYEYIKKMSRIDALLTEPESGIALAA